MYGQPPTFHIPYVSGTSIVDKVDRTLTAWEEAINVLKFHLRRARDRMKAIADGHKSNRTYEFYGPFQVLEKALRDSS
ncbi:hypothetical protein Tco_0480790 [Tanacetum coccineum]